MGLDSVPFHDGEANGFQSATASFPSVGRGTQVLVLLSEK
jgi:hypothetical protein